MKTFGIIEEDFTNYKLPCMFISTITCTFKCEKEANEAHYEVGKKVRKAIADIGGTMPEELPTPEKSLKQLEKEKN